MQTWPPITAVNLFRRCKKNHHTVRHRQKTRLFDHRGCHGSSPLKATLSTPCPHSHRTNDQVSTAHAPPCRPSPGEGDLFVARVCGFLDQDMSCLLFFVASGVVHPSSMVGIASRIRHHWSRVCCNPTEPKNTRGHAPRASFDETSASYRSPLA